MNGLILQVYSKKYGLSITDTYSCPEGAFKLNHVDAKGEVRPLIDIESETDCWKAYSTSQARIVFDRVYKDEIEIRDGMMCVINAFRTSEMYFLMCSDTQNIKTAVSMYALPLNGSITVGYAGCDINYPHTLVSKVNSVFRTQNGKVMLEDNASANGTYVNRISVSKKELAVGDVMDLFGLRIVYLGTCIAVYSIGEAYSVSGKLTAYNPNAFSDENGGTNIHLLPENEILFERSPRIARKRDENHIQIDTPPAGNQPEEMPLVFTVGSSALMSMSSMMMAMMSIQNAQATGAGMMSALPSMFMAGSMFLGGMIMPIATRKYTEKKNKKKDDQRISKYIAYLNEHDAHIREIGEKQKKRLVETYPETEELIRMVQSLNGQVWSRLPKHHDFLSLRLGIASQPVEVDITYPSQNFTVEEDELRKAVIAFKEKERVIEDAPFMLPLKETGVLGVYAAHDIRIRYVRSLIMQLCAQHSYQELKLAVIHNENESAEWEWVRWLPHIWSENRELRAIGTNDNDFRQISSYIDSFMGMADSEGDPSDVHLVVVISDLRLAERCAAVTDAMKNISRKPISIIALADRVNQLPRECKSVITLNETEGYLYRNIDEMESPVRFTQDRLSEDKVRPFASQMSRMVLSGQSKEGDLPDMLSFYGMMRWGNVNQVDLVGRWKKSNPIKTLAAPVGVDVHGELMNLDIHQNAHGPHGLIAGMTGSGKSEFVITYLLSVAAHYSPLEVGFILIDYKGGGMSDTLKMLPHVVGIIDNLGGRAGIIRSMTSITSELKRRQRVFKETGEQLGLSNLDIHKYQKLYREGKVNQPMQHLIIVSDEFAELKQQEPQFMDDLVSAARIGRSLGVHLILATQKPTGVVNDQITSNTRFRVCLKVQDKSDSMEMLARPEAAMLTKTGRYYLQVGFNEVFQLGQSAYSGAPSIPQDRYTDQPDNTIEILDNLGNPIVKAKVPDPSDNIKREKQVDELVKYCRAVAEREGLIPEAIWKPMLKPYELLDDIDKNYPSEFKPYAVDPVVGLADDPYSQTQYPLKVDFTADGNAIVYGITGSGKSEFVSAVIYSLCRHHSPEDVNIYCLDFASESAKMFSHMPLVGDVVVSGEDEKVNNLMNHLADEMARRRKILSSYGGALDVYRMENPKVSMPSILIIVDNYQAFSETYEAYDEFMYQIVREGPRFGVYTLITAISSTSVRYRMSQNFKQIYCMQMPDKADYSLLLGSREGAIPVNRVGSGVYKNEKILEFQVGRILPEETVNVFKEVQDLSRKMASEWKGGRAQRIRTLPDVVTVRDVLEKEEITLDRVPVGMEREKLSTCMWNLEDRYINAVMYADEPEFPFTASFVNVLSHIPDSKICVLDAAGTLEKTKNGRVMHFDKRSVDAGVREVFAEVLKRHNETKMAKDAGKPAPYYNECVMVVNGMTELYEAVSGIEQLPDMLDAIMKRGSRDLKMQVVFIQQVDRMSAVCAKEWYKKSPIKEGLWLGAGIKRQYILPTDSIPGGDKLPDNMYGYIIRRGKARMCKMIAGIERQ